MFITTADQQYGLSKKSDDVRRQHGIVISMSTVGVGAACLLLLFFVWDRQPQAALERQKRVILDEDGAEICHIPQIHRPEEFFDDIETVTGSCGSVVQMGKTAVTKVVDEEWGSGTVCNSTQAHYQWICLDKRLQITPPNCLVYSIGVDDDFVFEHDMERFGCDVYALDHVPRTLDTQRSSRIWFQNVRISTDSFDAHHNGVVVEKKRNLHQVVENLGHKHKTIDVLKIDSRHHEWEALKEFVTSHVIDQVKQLVITIDFRHSAMLHHTQGSMMDKLIEYYEILRMLDCDGFRIFSSNGRGDQVRVDGVKRPFYPEYEISYINTNFFGH